MKRLIIRTLAVHTVSALSVVVGEVSDQGSTMQVRGQYKWILFDPCHDSLGLWFLFFVLGCLEVLIREVAIEVDTVCIWSTMDTAIIT